MDKDSYHTGDLEQTDKQTDRQPNRQVFDSDKQTDRQGENQADGQRYMQTDDLRLSKQTKIQKLRSGRWTGRQAGVMIRVRGQR